MSFLATLSICAILTPHNLCAKVDIQGHNLRIEAWFDNDTPADGAKVKLLLNKKTLHEATTDERGLCSIPTPGLGNYTIEVNAGGGHRTEITLSLEAEASDLAAGDNKDSVQQKRWWGAILGVAIILLLTVAARRLMARKSGQA